MRKSKCTREARKCTKTNCRMYIAISILQINDTTLLLLLMSSHSVRSDD
jgi:hypothetical protein